MREGYQRRGGQNPGREAAQRETRELSFKITVSESRDVKVNEFRIEYQVEKKTQKLFVGPKSLRRKFKTFEKLERLHQRADERDRQKPQEEAREESEEEEAAAKDEEAELPAAGEDASEASESNYEEKNKNRYFIEGKRLNVCAQCRKPGHQQQDCRRAQFKCFYCLSKHRKQECPLSSCCFRCGQTGHSRDQCPAREQRCRQCDHCHDGRDCNFLAFCLPGRCFQEGNVPQSLKCGRCLGHWHAGDGQKFHGDSFFGQSFGARILMNPSKAQLVEDFSQFFSSHPGLAPQHCPQAQAYRAKDAPGASKRQQQSDRQTTSTSRLESDAQPQDSADSRQHSE